MSDDQKIHCRGCGGWLIDGGAVFVKIIEMRDGEVSEGFMCEICYLSKLRLRGTVNRVDFPEIGVQKPRQSRYSRRSR